MTNDCKVNSNIAAEMHWRKIDLSDGRYMIFYNFGESLSAAPADEIKNPAPDVQPEATEEKNV